MPNGNDRNWVRVRAALEGFFVRHGRWPTRVRLYPDTLRDLRDHLFLPASWRRLTDALTFVADEHAPIVAEDDDGNAYSYGEDFLPERPRVTAEQWLGVAPDAPGAHDG
jgi:hypothetical protein